MSKSIQMKDINNEKMYPHPYFPIGFIVLTVVDTNPSKWFDGTWELIAQGRTLVGVDTNDSDFNEPKKTGGAKTHTLSVDEMPAHQHNQNGSVANSSGYSNMSLAGNSYTGGETGHKTSKVGGGQAHNNLQPYFTCYIWCRTA